MRKYFKEGFTLIELLVVIAIIGILASLALVSFSSSQKQARDTQRKSDLNQYRTSMEAYASAHNGLYPSRTSPQAPSSSLCTVDLALTNCPVDPNTTDPSFGYFVETNGSSSGTADATQYVFWAKLENTLNYWVVCSNGKSGNVSQSTFVVPTAGTGTCPI